MAKTVLECLLHWAFQAFFISAFVCRITIIQRLRIELFAKLPIVFEKSEIPVQDCNEAWNQIEKVIRLLPIHSMAIEHRPIGHPLNEIERVISLGWRNVRHYESSHRATD
jgi:hypothetical protein